MEEPIRRIVIERTLEIGNAKMVEGDEAYIRFKMAPLISEIKGCPDEFWMHATLDTLYDDCAWFVFTNKDNRKSSIQLPPAAIMEISDKRPIVDVDHEEIKRWTYEKTKGESSKPSWCGNGQELLNEWDYDRKIEKKYRYRTETFSGLEEYDPAAVIDHETFELQNADIPEYLANTILKDSPLAAKLMKIVQWLEYDDIEPPVDEEKSIDFCREIVAEIEKVTGISLNYVLWLTDLDAVTDKDFYGKYINNEYDIDTYQIGHIVLAELGYDGTLYGYTNHPIPLEKQLEELKDALKDVTDERESDTLTVHRADHLDARYTELDNEISMIKKVLNVKESLTREKLNKQK